MIGWGVWQQPESASCPFDDDTSYDAYAQAPLPRKLSFRHTRPAPQRMLWRRAWRLLSYPATLQNKTIFGAKPTCQLLTLQRFSPFKALPTWLQRYHYIRRADQAGYIPTKTRKQQKKAYRCVSNNYDCKTPCKQKNSSEIIPSKWSQHSS